MDRKPYQPRTVRDDLRQECVDMPDGSYIWVRELTVAEMAQILDRSARPSIDPRGGHDQTALMMQQVVCSCYDSDEPGAGRIFSGLDLSGVASMRGEEFERVVAAIQRVNGKDATSEEITRDFLLATGGPNSSG